MTKRVFPDVKFVDTPTAMPADAQAIRAIDHLANSGDYKTEIGGYMTPDGKFHLTEVSIVRRNPQHRIKELRTKIKNRKR